MTTQWSEELFELPLADLPVAGERLDDVGRRMDAVARSHGSTLVRDPSVYATPQFVEDLCGAIRPSRAGRAAVRPDALHSEYGRNQFGVDDAGARLIYPLVAQPCAQSSAAVPEAVDLVDVERRTVSTPRPQPGRMAEPILAIATDSFVWNVAHWTDLLIANLLALQVRVSAINSNTIASDARVHPTAVVENSVVGSGATVGPYAVVRNSVLDTDVHVEEHVSIAGSIVESATQVQTGALVHGSVVGPSTVVSFHCALWGSVVLGRSTVSAPVVARSLVGHDVFLARGVTIGASHLGDEVVRVRSAGRSLASGLRLLGCVVGSGARVGNGTELPPGYEVPAHRYLAQRPVAPVPVDAAERLPLVQIEGRFRQLGFARSGS